jgi:isocitrate lyase
MAAYVELQQAEFAAQEQGYTAAAHQGFVGVGYYDPIALVASGGATSTEALKQSTEAEQLRP